MIEPSQTEWEIERLVPGGAGFVRLESGQGAFAAGALPGERIRVEQVEDHRTYLNATRFQLLGPSADRITAECPVQASCGGCDLMMLRYPAQLEAKRGMLREALTRTGRFQDLPAVSFQQSSLTLGYRSRIRLHVGTGGRLGFFAAKSQELVEIPGCLVADPALDAALTQLRLLARRHGPALSQFSEIELRVAPAGPRLSLWLKPRTEKPVEVAELLAALGASFHVVVGDRPADPTRDQRFPLPAGVELRAPAHVFTQVNWRVNSALVAALLAGVERRSVRSFCDLYCGAGNFSLPLFAHGLVGVGIEASRPAIDAARRAAAEQGLLGARFLAADVGDALSRLPRAERFDLVVLDPPRTGAREIIAEIAQRAPLHLAYCACDPVTLARDLRELCDRGYVLDELAGFDMFPQTHHFETLAWLRRA